MHCILVTGGCGFIGSHTVLNLLEQGYIVFVIDSNINSDPKIISIINNNLKKKNIDISSKLKFFKGDLRFSDDIENVFLYANKNRLQIDSVIHFAGLKSIKESIKHPILYWDFNFLSTINLIKVMQKFSCRNIIFSSSATIYDNAGGNLIDESFVVRPDNPYGKTKALVESFLEDIFNSELNKWKIINLRYFNPIGAHKEGILGEQPNGMPDNLFPIILKVAAKELKKLKVFGNDWNTRDGTCIRDYIHVMDLAEGHIAACDYLQKSEPKISNFNIGTGLGTTVLELINIFQDVNKVKIPYYFAERRKGDQEVVIASTSKLFKTLNWRPKRDIEDMCKDGWNWKINNIT